MRERNLKCISLTIRTQNEYESNRKYNMNGILKVRNNQKISNVNRKDRG